MPESNFVVINEIALQKGEESGNVVILKENIQADSSLVMFVGDPEFLAIAKEKGLVHPPRPLTHELYLRILKSMDIKFLRVEIYDTRNQSYIANVYYRKNGEEVAIDSRPSDAIALALNQRIPILVHQKLLKKPVVHEEIDIFRGIIRSVRF